MKKNRIEKLIPIANEALLNQFLDCGNNSKAILRKNDENQYYIKSNYDGKVSGFGVSVAVSGLRPTLAIYYNDSGDVKTRPVLDVLARIIEKDEAYNYEIGKLGITQNDKDKLLLKNPLSDRSLLDLAIKPEMNKHLPILKKYVLEASIALKQVVRTYELI